MNLQRALWVAHIAAEVLLTLTLLQRTTSDGKRLWKRYPFFICYLGLDALGGTTLALIDYQSIVYAQIFRFYQVGLFVLRLGVASELYERILEHFRGMGKFRFYLAGWLLVLTGAVSFIIFRPDVSNQVSFPQTCVILAQRFETTALVILLIALRWVLRSFLNVRPEIRPNVRRHWKYSTAYFGISAAASAAVILAGGGPKVLWINIAMLAADMICYGFWMKGMQPSGQQLPPSPPRSPEEEAFRREVKDAILEELSKR